MGEGCTALQLRAVPAPRSQGDTEKGTSEPREEKAVPRELLTRWEGGNYSTRAGMSAGTQKK